MNSHVHNYIIQGTKQWVEFRFKQEVCPSSISLTFQGGFAAKCCQALLKPTSKSDLPVEFDAVYPQDLNNSQEFKLVASASEAARIGGTRLRLTLSQQADFYGRVILYSVQVKGTIATAVHST